MKLSGAAQSDPQRARYIWGATVVWAAIWAGTAVVLKGGGTFADMIPVLAVGTGWFLAVVPGQPPPSTTAAQVTTEPERPGPDGSQP